MRTENGFLSIKKAPVRPPRVITFGREVRVEELNPVVKEVELPQIVSEMPEAVGEVQEVLANGEQRAESLHVGIHQEAPRKRGRPKGTGKKEQANE